MWKRRRKNIPDQRTNNGMACGDGAMEKVERSESGSSQGTERGSSNQAEFRLHFKYHQTPPDTFNFYKMCTPSFPQKSSLRETSYKFCE